MFVYQLIFYLQRIHLLDYFRQFTDSGDAVQMHNTNHLCQYTRKM